jgi:hypothetical protein
MADFTGLRGMWNAARSGNAGDFASRVIDPGDLFGGRGMARAARQQEEAQQRALELNTAAIGASRRDVAGAVQGGRADINAGTGQAANALQSGAGQAQGYLTSGLAASGGALQGGYGAADQQLAGLQRQQGPSAYDLTGQFGGQLSQLQAQQAQMGGIGQRVQMDPGMEFRRSQGEQAIGRSAAAQGGRLGGATLKALAGYNQDLASQEYGAAHSRAMGEQAQGFGQQAQIAGMGLSALADQAGRSDSMAQYGQQRQDMLGGQRAQNAINQGTGLASLYTGAAGQRADLAAGTGSQLSGLYSGQGAQLAGLGMEGAGMNTGLTQSYIDAQNLRAQSGGVATQGAANGRAAVAGTVGSIIGGIFGSDRNLKTDIDDGHDAAREMLEHITPATYRYRDESDGEGKWLGVMAQDLRQSYAGSAMVEETERGLHINAMKAIAGLLAVAAHLNQRIAALEGR